MDLRNAAAGVTEVTVVAHDVGGAGGGMERQLSELIRGLLRAGKSVTVIARRCELETSPRLRWVRVGGPRRPFTVAYPWFFVLGSMKVLRHRRGLLHTTGAIVFNHADVSTIHLCHHAARSKLGLRTRRASVLYRINARVATWLSLIAERCIYRPSRTRHLVAVSDGLGRELARHFPAMCGSITVIPNAVDHGAFRPDHKVRAAVRRQLGLLDCDLVALFVGGEWHGKGLAFVIEGATKAVGWRLIVVGTGDEARFRQLSLRLGGGDRVHFVGASSEPGRYYAAADAFVLPTAYEAFPLVALEACASGLPALSTRVNGVEDFLVDGSTGWFIGRDASDIAQRLDLLGRDPGLRQAMGQAARVASLRFTWRQVVSDYLGLYDRVAASPAVRVSERETLV